MTALYILLTIHLLAALLLALLGKYPVASRFNILASGAGFISSLFLIMQVLQHSPKLGDPTRLFYIDYLNVYLIALTAWVGFTTALFSSPYMRQECPHRNLGPLRMRLYHTSYQGFLFTMHLALSTNNLGVLWVALEGATLATVLLVSLYRTPEAIEAAWKYFMICGVGIALALFGTVLLYFATAQIIPDPQQALLWAMIAPQATHLNPIVMGLAFIFLLVGYGTKVGLVPMHTWLPDAHSEGPTPISAVLSGLLLNIALYAIIRIKILVDGALASGTAHTPQLAGQLMMGFGLLSFMVASLSLYWQRDIKRLYSYSSIEHMGLMTFGFGIGGPLATFGALLHMTAHSLTKSALFMCVGHASQITKTQTIDHIRGLIEAQPIVGWSLLIGTLAIAGLPPFGIFTSEFLLLTVTLERYPALTPLLIMGLMIAFANLFQHVQHMVYGDAPIKQQPVTINHWPISIHLGLVLWLGLTIPAFLAQWFNQTAFLITGSHLL